MSISDSPSILYPKKVNLTNCDKEPIHLIGKIQSHGYLLAFDVASKELKFASQNCATLFGGIISFSKKVLLSTIFPSKNQLINIDFESLSAKKMVFDIELSNKKLLGLAHVSHNLLIIELEPFEGTLDSITHQEFFSSFIEEANAKDELHAVSDLAAYKIKAYTGYDRVMIYKFDADWNGEVISESKEDHLESWLGLHYPATDIPKQARKSFLNQGVRVISDVHSSPVPVERYTNENQVLDLSNSETRAASPIHLEYLSNMGVNATMTIAIVYQGQLWGLVACHHYQPKFLGYHQRKACQFIGQLLASQLGQREANRLLELTQISNKVRSEFIEKVSQDWDLSTLISSKKINLMGLTNSTGVSLFHNGIFQHSGKVPKDTFLLDLISTIRPQAEQHVFHTNNLSAIFPKAFEEKAKASGVLIAFFGSNDSDAIMWFREESLEQVSWGGNPDKQVVSGSSDLSPRKSFEKWIQLKVGVSAPWLDHEVAAAMALREHISEIIIQKFDEIQKLNTNLKRAYGELETFSYSVSHDLRSPLRGIDGFAQILKEDYFESLDDFGKQAITTIIDSVDKMNLLIDDILSFSSLGKTKVDQKRVDFNKLVERVLDFHQVKLVYPNTKIEISKLPELKGDESMLFQLMNNLIGNALKYSKEKTTPEIKIQFEEGVFKVSDNGIGFDQHYAKKIFGIFNRLVGDEYKGSGVGLAIAKRVIEKHKGAIWVESKPSKGASFYFKLNNNE